MVSDRIEAIRKSWGGPMSKEEIEYLRNTQAFIEFAINNGLSFSFAMVGLRTTSMGCSAMDSI